MTKDKYLTLSMGDLSKSEEGISVSLSLIPKFENQWHYSWYRYSIIARHYMPDQSGVFTLNQFFRVMKEHFSYNSVDSLSHKLLKCSAYTEIPFMVRLGKDRYKVSSDKVLLAHFCIDDRESDSNFAAHTKIPVEVLRMVRTQYIGYMKLAAGMKIDDRSIKNLTEALGSIGIPTFN